MFKECMLTAINRGRVSRHLRRKKTMEPIANDFTINIATANGTGSQSANLILLQSIFDMGVPVSGKNLFPSNISGLPTWYIVRLSDQGYQAPGDRTHIQVLVNPATWDDDLAALEPGSIVIWNENAKKEAKIKELQSFVNRFSANASKAKQATSRANQINKIKLEDVKASSRVYPFIRFKQEKKVHNKV